MVDVQLDDEHFTSVPDVIVDRLAEHNWVYEEDSKQWYRWEDGRKLYLYHETLKWSAKEGLRWPTLERAQVESILREFVFSTPDVSVEVLWAELENILDMYGLSSPSLLDVLGFALTDMLMEYYGWWWGPRVVFRPDLTGLTPGKLVSIVVGKGHHPRAVVRKYETLGDWMDSENLDKWRKGAITPTGLAPETYGDYLIQKCQDALYLFLDSENPGVALPDLVNTIDIEDPLILPELTASIGEFVYSYEVPV